MSYQIKYSYEILFIPDGAGPMSVQSAQKLRLGTLDFAGLTVDNPQNLTPGQPTGYQQVPGGDTPTQANFNTAVAAAAQDIDVAIAANLARIQGFATGGG